MSTLCQSIKSKREPTVRCNRLCDSEGGKLYCGIHNRHVNKTTWREVVAQTSCSNQLDPISLDSLWEDTVIGDRVPGTIPANHVFYYMDSTFQRGLDINSMVLLVRYPIPMDPFTNLPMEQSVIDRAKQMISKLHIKSVKPSKKERLKKTMDEIVDCFYTLGFTIQRTHIENKTKQEYLKWLWEILFISKANNIEIPLTVQEIHNIIRTLKTFDEKMLNKLKTIALFSPMSTIITLTALCYVDPVLKSQYPTIFD